MAARPVHRALAVEAFVVLTSVLIHPSSCQLSNFYCGLVDANHTALTPPDVLDIGANNHLFCNIVGNSTAPANGSVSWSLAGKTLTLAKECGTDGYTSPTVGELMICMAAVQDAGTYTAHTNSDVHHSLSVYVAPYVAPSGNVSSVETKKGDTASISCAFIAYPQPTIVWLQGNATLTNSSRYSIVMTAEWNDTTREARSTLTVTDVQYSDRSRGEFSCVATNSRPSGTIIGAKQSASGYLRVRDPLGALWPALGIIGQGVVLVLILYLDHLYRKRKVKDDMTEVLYTKDSSGQASADGTVSFGDSARGRRLSEQYRGDVPLLSRTNSSSPPHGYSV